MKKNIEYEKLADTVNYIYFMHSKGRPRDNHVLSLKGTMIGPHYHKAVEMKMLLEGQLTFGVDGEQYEVRPGEICFSDSYRVHYYRGKGCVWYDLVIDNSYINNLLGENFTFDKQLKNKELFEDLKTLFDKTFKVWDEMDAFQKQGFVARVLGTIMQYEGAHEKTQEDKKKHKIAQEIIQYIFNHYQEEINIKNLANQFGYAEGYFSRLFNQITGVSLREYINRYRIELVDKLKTENPDRPLIAISEEVGYNSWATFYRAYTKYSKLKDKE